MPEESDIPADAVLPAGCSIDEQWVGRVAVLAVTGTVDMLTAPQLEQAVSAALAQSPAALVVDLTDVEFLASAGMSVLITAHEKAGSTVAFGVVADGPVTGRPLKLIGIADLVDVFPTLDEALAKLAA